MVLLVLDKFHIIIVIHLTSMILLGAEGTARKEKKKKRKSARLGKGDPNQQRIMLLLSTAVLPFQPSLGNSGKQGRIHLCQGPLGVIGKPLSQDTEVNKKPVLP